MPITKRTIVRDLLEEYPDAVEVFANLGIDSDELGPMSTMEEVCKDEGINYWELKSDIINGAEWRIDDSEDFEDDEEDDGDEESEDELNEWEDDEDDYDVEDDDDIDGEDEDEEPEEDE